MKLLRTLIIYAQHLACWALGVAITRQVMVYGVEDIRSDVKILSEANYRL